MNESCDVAIIGGGLIGCATAYELSKAGASVVLLERGQLNQGASGRNAGSLHFQLEHRLIQDIDLRARDLEYFVGLSRFAIGQWQSVERELGADIELHMNGGLMVAESAAEIALLERKQRLEQGQGLDIELLDGAGARRLAPYLSGRVQAALVCAGEGYCNPRHLTLAYAHRAQRHGARFLPGAAVGKLARRRAGWQVTYREGGAAGRECQLQSAAVLNAAGAWAADVARMANVHLPLFPIALSVNVTERIEPCIAHLIQHVGRKLSLKQTGDGNLLLGGGGRARLRQRNGQWSEEPPEILLQPIVENLRAAAAVVPLVSSLRLLRSWTGTAAITPDELPILGEVARAPGFFVAAGGPGFTNGPAYALLMSELMLGRRPSWPLDPFSPQRFGVLNAYMGS